MHIMLLLQTILEVARSILGYQSKWNNVQRHAITPKENVREYCRDPVLNYFLETYHQLVRPERRPLLHH